MLVLLDHFDEVIKVSTDRTGGRVMAFRRKWLIFSARVTEKARHAFSNAHYLHPTRSRQEKRKAKRKTRKAATGNQLKLSPYQAKLFICV